MRGGLASVWWRLAQECLQPEFQIAPLHDAFDRAVAEFGGERQDIHGHLTEAVVVVFHPVQLLPLPG